MSKIKNVNVRYGEKKEISLGNSIQEFITNIAVAFDNLPKDYVLKYSESPGRQLIIGCKKSYDDFTNKLLSLGFKCEYLPTIYLNKCQSLSSELEKVIQIDEEFINQFDKLQLNENHEVDKKKCDDCYSQVQQYFRCLECVEYILCKECFKILREKQHFQNHQFIFVSRPSKWQDIKRDAIFLIKTLKSTSKVYKDQQQLIHNQIQCDECQAYPILQYRYKCLECQDYDLCNECFLEKIKHQQHNSIRLDKPIQFQNY